MDRFVLSQHTLISDKLQGKNGINSNNIDFLRADALLKQYKVQKLGNRACHRYLFALIHPSGYLLNLPIIYIAAHKVYNPRNNYSTNPIHGGYQSYATTTLIRAIPPSPKSYITAVIDAAAKRILDVYRDAFTELVKGTDD